MATINLAINAGMGLSADIVPPPAGGSGRYRAGDTVPFVFTVPPGLTLTSSPILTVTADGGRVVGTYPLWSWDDGRTWQVGLVLSQLFGIGRLLGSTVLMTTAGPRVLQQQFTVVPGGDFGSSVIALHASEGAAGRHVLVQLRTGEIVKGTDPWI